MLYTDEGCRTDRRATKLDATFRNICRLTMPIEHDQGWKPAMSTLCERCSALFSGQWEPRVDDAEDDTESETDEIHFTRIEDINHKVSE